MSGQLPGDTFKPDCRKCARLSAFLEDLRTRFPDYFNLPVPSFGPAEARLLVVGLAPGMHGANATGRPFTGDHAGILLYQTLFDHGFSTAPESVDAADALSLLDCRITNAVRCLPPGNKPVGSEVNSCNPFLAREVGLVQSGGVVVALGGVAHRAVLKAMGLRQAAYKFGHGAEHVLPGNRVLIDSYHCSRYNTQTRRLTNSMFAAVFRRAQVLLDAPRAPA